MDRPTDLELLLGKGLELFWHVVGWVVELSFAGFPRAHQHS